MNASGGTSDIWAAICSRLGIDPEKPGALDRASELIPDVGRGSLQRIKEASASPRMATLEKIAGRLQCKVQDLLAGSIGSNPILTTDDTDGVAQALSHRQPIIDPPKVQWEQLSVTKLEGLFAMEIRGEALVPRFFPGQPAVWQACDSAQDGQPVLIELEGSFFLRFYEGRGATWAGVSERAGHRELQPEHGAKIVARLRYLDFG